MPRITRSQARKAACDATEDSDVLPEDKLALVKSKPRVTRAKAVTMEPTSPLCSPSIPDPPISPVKTRTRVLRSSTAIAKKVIDKLDIPTIQVEEVVAEESEGTLGTPRLIKSIQPTKETPISNESQLSDSGSNHIAELNRKKPSRSSKSMPTNNAQKIKAAKPGVVDAGQADDITPILRKTTRSRASSKDLKETATAPGKDVRSTRSTRLRKAANLEKSEQDTITIPPKEPCELKRIEQPTLASTTRPTRTVVGRNAKAVTRHGIKETPTDSPLNDQSTRRSRQTKINQEPTSIHENIVTVSAKAKRNDKHTVLEDIGSPDSTSLCTTEQEPSKMQLLETANTNSPIVPGEVSAEIQNYSNQINMDSNIVGHPTNQPIAAISGSLETGRALLRGDKSYKPHDHAVLLALCNLPPLEKPKRQAMAKESLSNSLEIEGDNTSKDIVKISPTFNLDTEGQDKENSPIATGTKKGAEAHSQPISKQNPRQAPKQTTSTPRSKTTSKPLSRDISTPVSKPVFNQASTPVSRQLSKKSSTPLPKQVTMDSSATATPRSFQPSAYTTVAMTKAARLRAENNAAAKGRDAHANKASIPHKPIHDRNVIGQNSPAKATGDISKSQTKVHPSGTPNIKLRESKQKATVQSAVKPSNKKTELTQIPTEKKKPASRLTPSATPAKTRPAGTSPTKLAQTEATSSKPITGKSAHSKAPISEDAMIKRLLALPSPPKTCPSEGSPAKPISTKASLPNLASAIVSPSKAAKTIRPQPVSKAVSPAKVTNPSVPLNHSPVKKSITSAQPSPRKISSTKVPEGRGTRLQGTDAAPSPAGKSQIGDLRKRMATAPKPVIKSTKPLTKPSFELSGVARSRELAGIRAERMRKLEELEKAKKEKSSPTKKTRPVATQRAPTIRTTKTLPTQNNRGFDPQARSAVHGGIASSPLKNGSSRSTLSKSSSIPSEAASSSSVKNSFPTLDKLPTDIYPSLKTVVQMNDENRTEQSPQISQEEMQRRQEERLQASMRGMQAVNEWAAMHGSKPANKAT